LSTSFYSYLIMQVIFAN